MNDDLRMWLHCSYVSSWYMGEHESAAMWRLYAKSEEAVVVCTTFAKLNAILPAKAHLGQVKYIDYSTSVIPREHLAHLMHKRLSYQHEHEARAILVEESLYYGTYDKKRPEGKWIDLDLSKLIEGIYIAPTAPPWFVDVVEGTLKQFQIDWPVRRSDLGSGPLW